MADKLSLKVAPVFEKIGALTKVQRLVICVATLAIVGGVYYFFFLKPGLEKIKSEKAKYQSQLALLQRTKKNAAELEKYEKLMAEAQEAFNIAIQALPEKREVPALLTDISKAGTKAGLTFHLFKPTKEIKSEFYIEIPVSIKVSGRYHQLTDFFYQIARLNRIVTINDIVIKEPKESNIEMDCKATTYMFVEKKDTPQDKTNKQKNQRRRRG